MLRFAHPGFLGVAAVAGAIVVVLHLLARHERRAELLPTARFVPNDVAASAIRIDRLRDVVLLMLRLAVVLLVGLAAARPDWTWRQDRTARVLLVDRGWPDEGFGLTDSVRAISGAGPAVIVAFDTSARLAAPEALTGPDTARRTRASSLSAALIAGIRAAEPLRARYSRVELHLLSPLHRAALDAATRSIRALWPDSIHLHSLPAGGGTRPASIVDFDAGDEDPVAAGARLALGGVTSEPATVRMRRGELSQADSIWGRAARRVLVRWPPASTNAGQDTLMAAVTTAGVVVGYFDAVAAVPRGTAIAWWGDGAIAASEAPNADGCIRSVGFAPSANGDGALSFAMQRLMRRLAAPCGSPTSDELLSNADAAALVASPRMPAVAFAQPPRGSVGSLLPLWLLLAAGCLLAIEAYVRSRPDPAVTGAR